LSKRYAELFTRTVAINQQLPSQKWVHKNEGSPGVGHSLKHSKFVV